MGAPDAQKGAATSHQRPNFVIIAVEAIALPALFLSPPGLAVPSRRATHENPLLRFTACSVCVARAVAAERDVLGRELDGVDGPLGARS